MTLVQIDIAATNSLTHCFRYRGEDSLERTLAVQDWVRANRLVALRDYHNDGVHWIISDQWALIFSLRWL
jgi:hypothetical protein